MATGDLVVTDLDGTLWRTEDEVHPSTIHAFHALLEAHVPVVVATGRRRGSARRGLLRLGLTPPAIVLNGALGLELATELRFQSVTFSSDSAARMLHAFRLHGLDPCLYVDEAAHEVVVSPCPSTHPTHLDSLERAVRIDDLEAVVADQRVHMLSLIGLPHSELVKVANEIGEEAEVHLDRAFDVPGMASITVTPPGLSKWDGVLAWCRHAGITPSRVIAIGDGPNDVELLTAADLALVPEIAHPDAHRLADHVIPSPEFGGWAEVLNFL